MKASTILLAYTWILTAATTILLYLAITGSLTALALLALGTTLLVYRPYKDVDNNTTIPRNSHN